MKSAPHRIWLLSVNWRHPIGYYVTSAVQKDGTQQFISGDYTGTFNGNGHTISNLYINNAEDGGYGAATVAMEMQGSTIRNVTVSPTVVICGSSYVGGIVSSAAEGSSDTIIENCTNYAAITGEYKVGGIIGYTNREVDVFSCINYGAVTGIDQLGGIAGTFAGDSYYDGRIYGCINYGTVTRTEEANTILAERTTDERRSVGGIVGYNGSTIRFCINAGFEDGKQFPAFDIGNNEASMDPASIWELFLLKNSSRNMLLRLPAMKAVPVFLPRVLPLQTVLL